MINNQKNKEFFSQLYDKYADEIYRFSLSKVNSPEIAEDLASETFLKGWQYFVSDKPPLDSPRAFFYQIVRNLIVDFYRKKQTEAVLVGTAEKDYENQKNIRTADISSDFLQQFQGITSTPIGEALSKLKNEHQEVLTLRYVEDLSIPEIGKILRKNPVTVRVAIHRALGALKRIMNRES